MQIRKLYETLSEINGKLSAYFKYDMKSFFNFLLFVFAHNTIQINMHTHTQKKSLLQSSQNLQQKLKCERITNVIVCSV